MSLIKDVHIPIVLKGSAKTVAEFFYYGVNSILHQRMIYPADSFKRTQKYGTTILVTADEKLNNYITSVMARVEEWLKMKGLLKLVVVIAAFHTGEVMERWQFDVSVAEEEAEAMEGCEHEPDMSNKSEKKIGQEIADVIRQITASVTFLPLLETPCSFDILVYTDGRLDVPKGWSDTAPSYVINSRDVQLRQFSTGVHAVGTTVTYKADDV